MLQQITELLSKVELFVTPLTNQLDTIQLGRYKLELTMPLLRKSM